MRYLFLIAGLGIIIFGTLTKNYIPSELTYVHGFIIGVVSTTILNFIK